MSAADLLQKLYKAPSAEECYAVAEELAQYVNTNGLRVLQTEAILDNLVKATKNKKSGFEREAGVIGLDAIFTKVAGKNAPTPLGAEPWLLYTLPAILELYADKGDVVRQAAETAAGSLFALMPAESAAEFLEVIYEVLGSSTSKWQAKVGALKLLGRLSGSAHEQVGDELVNLIPYLTNAMHETKAEISKQAFKTAIKVCEACLDNKDIRPFIPDLVGCMAQPDAVAECIKKLSGTTFVAEVTGPALAVMVPLLVRALNERNQNVQRQTVVVVDNLCKLVRDPHEAAKFLPALTPGVERIEKGASFPEVREHAKSARETLAAATEAIGDDALTEDPKKIFAQQTAAALDATIAVVQSRVSEEHANVKSDKFALTGLQYVARSIVRLATKRIIHASAWNDVYVLPYLRRVCKDTDSAELATDELRKMYIEIDKTRFGNSDEDDDDEAGECLCRTEFSLAYGGLLLLNHTTLKLYRGHRYGVVAANGSGKSTLLRAMRDGKVEGYPTQDQVRTLMVEHSLQGEDGATPIIDFIANDKNFSSKTREEIASKLEEVGFDSEKQQNPVSSLSGGWKMKLELARAMLSDAVVYLLDEPTNHLDVASIAWLENFLISNNQITVVTVSHDSGFLDNICTDIIHYEKKKLRYYKGNLSDFVATKPEAKAYYSLSSTTVKFSFPPPGSLMGVRSNTRTILKASNCTFTYPGMSKPSLNDQTCAISLSSRVGVLGPNGAGKSTLIKVLTGEVVPQQGKVEKHPNLRIAMMAQHAFHHLEQHLEKTAVEYIAWRYQDGHDREMTEKASRKMTSEEKAQMDTPIVSKTGESRKVEFIVGRQKLKKSYQYEIKWVGYEHKNNIWIPRERLLELGFSKLVQQFDDFEASREGAGSREISVKLIRQHLEAVGLQGEIAQHHAVGGYSGGQKVKVVLAAAMWNNPQVLVLDEPTNYLDRDALGGLATAIRDWAGAVVIISHNMEFVGALCPEIWHVENGVITGRSKAQLAEGAFADDDSTPADSVPGTPLPTSTVASRLASRVGTPTSSAMSTPVGSDGEEDMTKFKAKKGKKKMSRNDKKAQEERRRLRLSRWLSYGGEREPDTEDEKP